MELPSFLDAWLELHKSSHQLPSDLWGIVLLWKEFDPHWCDLKFIPQMAVWPILFRYVMGVEKRQERLKFSPLFSLWSVKRILRKREVFVTQSGLELTVFCVTVPRGKGSHSTRVLITVSPQSHLCLNSWSFLLEMFAKKLGGVALLEEECHWGAWLWGFETPEIEIISCLSLCVSYFVDQGVSSPWLLLASFCPTIMDSDALKLESITNYLYELLCSWCPIAAIEK